MKKRIVPIIALLLALTISLSVSAFAAKADEQLINQILEDASERINELMDGYAELSFVQSASNRWRIDIKVINGNVEGITVYNDIVDELINQLNGYPDDLSEISPNKPGADHSIPLTGEEITTGQIVQFVMALGLKDGDNAFGPSSLIGALVGQSFTAYITGTDDQVYEWNVYFTK